MKKGGGETGTARSRSCKGKAVGMSLRTGTGAVNRYRTYGTAATGSVLERKTAKYRLRRVSAISAARRRSTTTTVEAELYC